MTKGLVGVLFLVALAAVLSPAEARATSSYASQTGKDCTYCHETPGGPLTEAGTAFREDGYRLPPEGTPAPPSTDADVDEPATTTTTPPAGQDGSGGPRLSLPRPARLLIRWAHVLAAIAWLGGIISVFVVQTPQVAFAGIPSRYLALAWPSMLVTGATGVVLTLSTVGDYGALPHDRWGRILLIKIGIYLLLLAIGATATFVVSPRLKRASDPKRRRSTSQDQYRAQGRVTVQFRGGVYDVTGSRLWPEGRHARRHDAWQDLTSSLSAAPHGPEVFERFAMIAGGEAEEVPVVMRAFMMMTRFSIALVVLVVFVVAIW